MSCKISTLQSKYLHIQKCIFASHWIFPLQTFEQLLWKPEVLLSSELLLMLPADTRYSVLTELKANRKIILLTLPIFAWNENCGQTLGDLCFPERQERENLSMRRVRKSHRLCVNVWVQRRCRCIYVNVRTCMSEVRGAVSKYCGCQFDTHPVVTSPRGHSVICNISLKCFTTFKMRLLSPPKGRLTPRPPRPVWGWRCLRRRLRPSLCKEIE